MALTSSAVVDGKTRLTFGAAVAREVAIEKSKFGPGPWRFMVDVPHGGGIDCLGKVMIRTVEAIIDEDGNVRLLEPLHVSTTRRALVMILDERPTRHLAESALLSELALARDWDRPEEDDAWAHLQRAR